LFVQAEYYNMMKAPVEPQLQFAIKTLSAQNQQNQQNQQMSRQIGSSSGYGTMIPTPGITQGATGNARMPYTDNMGLSSSGAGMVPQNTNMGNSMPGADCFTQLVLISLGLCVPSLLELFCSLL
jgi:E1A/CREB-binding protein